MPFLVDQQCSPLVFRGRQKDFQVRSRPARWFARADWWLGERAHRGIGAGIIEFEMSGFLATADDRFTSFELLHNTASNSWKIIRRFE